MAHDLLPTHVTRPARLPAVGPFGALQAQMTRMLEEMWRDVGGTGVAGAALPHPSVDIAEDATAVHVTAEIPGLAEDEVEVTVQDDHLHIAGEKVKETGEGRRDVVSERAYGRFDRWIPVGRNIDRDRVEARFDNGVLRVTLPKTETDADRRRIEVKRGG